MEEILLAIDKSLIDVPEKNKEEYRKLSITLAELKLSRGYSISSIIDFIIN